MGLAGEPAAQYDLAGRGLSAAGAWAVSCVLVVPVSFLLAAGLRRLLSTGRRWNEPRAAVSDGPSPC